MTTSQAKNLRQRIFEHLMEHGPATADEIHAALLVSGATTARTPNGVRTSLGGSRFCFQRPDKRWDLTTRALAGVVLTVRPRSRLRDNVLWTHADLEPFDTLLVEGSIPLLNGGVAMPGGGLIRTLTGPDGWLPDVPPGGLIGLRWTGTGLDVFEVDSAALQDDAGQIRDLFIRHRVGLRRPYDYRETGVATVLLSVLREAPDLFSQPHPPLSEIFPQTLDDLRDTSIYVEDGTQDLMLRVPHRVYEELERRAGLLGERIEDHAVVLLGGATDRVRIDTRPVPEYEYLAAYDDESDHVVRPLRVLP